MGKNEKISEKMYVVNRNEMRVCFFNPLLDFQRKFIYKMWFGIKTSIITLS